MVVDVSGDRQVANSMATSCLLPNAAAVEPPLGPDSVPRKVRPSRLVNDSLNVAISWCVSAMCVLSSHSLLRPRTENGLMVLMIGFTAPPRN